MSDENKTCCCCFDLKTGAFICAYIHLIYILALGIATVTMLAFEMTKDDGLNPRNIMITVYLMYGWAMFMCLLYLAFTIILIVGLHKDQPKYVLSFIAFQYLVVSRTIVRLIRYCFNFDLALFSYELLFFIITSYFLIVLKNYHEKMHLNLAAVPRRDNIQI
ncbi:uncharacterized protein LOC113503879 [Trichoplusia ni]|uniref:Uncharacterized protein LOC113503879 n=1 Tax=Trichoplusia ni TaxID=7111 RepID=A0A7E5WNU4_TRINI|nr:uncharacterized protein LOC113503879 [Trichoplusia ni]